MTTAERSEITVPTKAIQPDSLNHLVLNVSDLERSHAFWSDIVGFKEVVSIPNAETGDARARFYRGKDGTGHHDLALFQIANPEKDTQALQEWSMAARNLGVNHVAIKYHDREEWLQQIAFMQSKGVKFHVRTEHGMTHSAYISDPDGYGIEILYEVPREAWEQNPGAAVVWARRVATEGPDALRDGTDYKVFAAADPATPDFG
ncbi:MAG TPA: VOC family protein [Dehalococcoidia bacterium]|nr:VOC family protein [Dehalococcoidia bacterium]